MFNVENPNSDLNSAFFEFLEIKNAFNTGLHTFNKGSKGTKNNANSPFIVRPNDWESRNYVDDSFLFSLTNRPRTLFFNLAMLEKPNF